MSDTSVDEELFCSHNNISDAKDFPKFIRYPAYYYTEEFREYIEKNKIHLNKDYGYSFI